MHLYGCICLVLILFKFCCKCAFLFGFVSLFLPEVFSITGRLHVPFRHSLKDRSLFYNIRCWRLTFLIFLSLFLSFFQWKIKSFCFFLSPRCGLSKPFCKRKFFPFSFHRKINSLVSFRKIFKLTISTLPHHNFTDGLWSFLWTFHSFYSFRLSFWKKDWLNLSIFSITCI